MTVPLPNPTHWDKMNSELYYKTTFNYRHITFALSLTFLSRKGTICMQFRINFLIRKIRYPIWVMAGLSF